MKTLLIILFSLVILGCNRISETEEKPTKILPAKNEKPTNAERPFANPALIYGNSDFLNFLASLKQNQNIESLLSFTSAKSKLNHPRQSILSLYEKTNLHFVKKLKAIHRQCGSMYILRYVDSKFATRGLTTCTVAVELDTCRLVLPKNLNDFLR